MRVPALILAGLLTVSPLVADTYPRQVGIDVQHYVFRVEVTDTSDVLEGQTTVTVRIQQDGLAHLVLDLASLKEGHGMTVASVGVDGKPASFTHQDGRLTLALAPSLKAGAILTVDIRYAGIPAAGLRFLANKHGERSIFSESWPNHAHQWLPVVDHPSDKATAEMVVTAPAHYQVISNGLLVETTDLSGQRRRTHWRQNQPLPVWLYTVGIAHFAVHHAAPMGSIPLQSWVFPQEREAGWKALEDTARQAVGFFSAHIGPFPYDKLANVEAVALYGGMESATAIFYDQKLFRGIPLTTIVAHEIAHQWFGDSVTEADWDEVWLSEGFATYLADCFIEHAQGREGFVKRLKAERGLVIEAEASSPDTPILHRNLSDMDKVLNAFVYDKAAWVLHMLRNRVGDEAFWRGLRTYYAEHQHGNATTADFRRAMEAASGQTLEAFFTQWLTRSNLPRIAGTWRYDAGRQQIIVDLQQTQPGAPFQLPLTLGLGERQETVTLAQKRQQFVFSAVSAPAFIELDPNTTALIDAPGRLEPSGP